MIHKVIPSHTPGMYRIQWPDGAISKDCYNLSHAKENCRNLAEYEERHNQTMEFFISRAGRGILYEMGVRGLPDNRPILTAQKPVGAICISL